MQEIIIKKVDIEDVEVLLDISIRTFVESYAAGNTAENMQKYIAEVYTIEKIQAELENIDSQYYFAAYKNDIVGYIKTNTNNAQTELQDAESLEIERLYVLKEYQGKNIGQYLFDQSIIIAKDKQLQYIWLGVWDQNPRAQKFYERNGMIAFDKHIFKVGDDKQTDIMLRLDMI
jgi:diamine N-acetyltransferase